MILRKLVLGSRRISGRSSIFGKLTVFHRGGSGVKRKFRFVDLTRMVYDVPAVVLLAGEYDPNRSAFISLVCYENGLLSYILAPSGLSVGDRVLTVSGLPKGKLFVGDSAQLKYFPIGSSVFSVASQGGKKGKFARSAGVSCMLLKKFVDSGYVLLKLPSGVNYMVKETSFATNGRVSNPGHRFFKFLKAGRRRLLGFRPIVRGVAMNPVDHPHGGGEGKSGGGRPSVTPWGFITKGPKTRRKVRGLSFIVSRPHKNKKISY